jgi:hypothetical protein
MPSSWYGVISMLTQSVILSVAKDLSVLIREILRSLRFLRITSWSMT